MHSLDYILADLRAFSLDDKKARAVALHARRTSAVLSGTDFCRHSVAGCAECSAVSVVSKPSGDMAWVPARPFIRVGAIGFCEGDTEPYLVPDTRPRRRLVGH